MPNYPFYYERLTYSLTSLTTGSYPLFAFYTHSPTWIEVCSSYQFNSHSQLTQAHHVVYKPGNIGNAKTAGLQVDLGLNDSQWAWVLNAFYICYVLFEWTVLLWKLMPAHIYVASLCVL